MDRLKEEFMPFVRKTAEIIEAALTGDVQSIPYLDDHVIWIAQNGSVYLDKENAAEYLEKVIQRLGKIYDLDVSFVKELSPDCLSVTGRISFGIRHHAFTEMDVCFHASWIRTKWEWRLKHLATSSEKRMFREEDADPEHEFDLGLLYDKMPVGIIGCEDNPALSVRMMNPIILKLLGYQNLEELKENMGSSLLALVHPSDLLKMQEFIRTIQGSEGHQILKIRLRKTDYSYAWVQVTGSMFRKDMFVLLCMDYSEQYNYNKELSQRSKDASERE
ncbi:MAG: PAS domain-containing protein [Lachnospiraceae bacterium]|nr:PAS domain-containing protein [Lachnospiraceae bacterium]